MNTPFRVLAYQNEGAEFLAARKRAYLADDMGLGKTFQAIRAADAIGAGQILVVCPATLKENWAAEFDMWSLFPRSVAIVQPNQTRIPEAEILIMNYETLLSPSKFNQIAARKFDVAIFDEAHRLKNTKAARTQKALGPRFDGIAGVVGNATNVWWLSGTPAPNNASELFPACRFIYGEPMSYWTFLNRYCVVVKTGFGHKIVGQRNVAELRAKLKPYILRRTAEQVLKDLPAISFNQVHLTPDSGAELAKNAKAWDKLAETFGEKFAELDDDQVLKKLRTDSVEAGRLRHMVGVAKAPAVVQLVKTEFEAGLTKLIIFAWHTAVIDIIAEGLADLGVVIIDGRTPQNERHTIVQQFQTSDRIGVFIGNLQAAGEGITLTAANHVLFAEFSYVPKDNKQAAKRAHRIGQTRPVFARFASFPGTVDDRIVKAVARKTALLNELLEDENGNQV